MKILILDDDLNRHKHFRMNLIGHDLTHCETVEECIGHLELGNWDVCFLDHDLGGEVYVDSGKGTGFEVAQWIRNNPDMKPKEVIVHSLNPVGAKNMQDEIGRARRIPFAWTKKNLIS